MLDPRLSNLLPKQEAVGWCSCHLIVPLWEMLLMKEHKHQDLRKIPGFFITSLSSYPFQWDAMVVIIFCISETYVYAHWTEKNLTSCFKYFMLLYNLSLTNLYNGCWFLSEFMEKWMGSSVLFRSLQMHICKVQSSSQVEFHHTCSAWLPLCPVCWHGSVVVKATGSDEAVRTVGSEA